MRKIIAYILITVLFAQLAPVPSVAAEGNSNVYISPVEEQPVSFVEELLAKDTLTLEWLSQSFQLPENDLLEQLNKGYTLDELYAALQIRQTSAQSLDELLQQMNPEIENQLGQLDYSASRFEDEEETATENPDTNIDPPAEGEFVESTGELIVPDESLLAPSVSPGTANRQMLQMSNSYPTSYDQFAVKRLDIQRDSAPFSINSINENVSTISGSLSVQATDMVLPGRNGLSFALTRKYDSSDAQYYDKEILMGYPYTMMYYPELEGRLYDKSSSPNSLVSPQVGYAGNFVFDGSGYKSLVQMIGGQHTYVYYPTPSYPYVEFNSEVIDSLKSAWSYVDPNNINSPYLLAKDMVLNGIPLSVRYYTTGRVVTDPSFLPERASSVPVYINRAKPIQGENRFPIGKGWSWDLPYIETKDNNKKYIHLFGGSAYELDGLQLKGYPWKDLTLESGYFNLGDNRYASHRLKTLDGKKMYFTSQGQLIEIADAYNNTLQFEYLTVQPYGQVLRKVKDAIGNELTITYSATEVVVTLGDRTVRYNKIKDPQGNKELLSQVTDAMGRKTQYAYDIKPVPFDIVGAGRTKDNFIALLKQVYHPTKARTDYGYADFDRSLGNSAKERAYRVTSREDVVTYTDGTVTKSNRLDYTYNSDGAMAKPYNSSFSTTVNNGRIQATYHYDRVYIDENTPEVYYNTQVVNSSGAQQSIDTMEYNRTKRWPVPTKVTSQIKQGTLQSTASIVSRDYNDYGNVTSETDPNNKTTTYTYDAQNLLSSSIVPVNTKSLYVELERYPGTNGIKTVRMKENSGSGILKAQTSYVYDSYGNPKTVTLKDDSRDIVITNEYDVALYKAAYPTRQSIQVTGADNQNTLVAQQFRYKLSTGEMTSHTDGKGFVTQMEYDKLGRMIKATHQDQSSVSVLFDDNQNQVTVTDETGVKSVVKWNPLGLKVSEGIVGKGTTTYGYDAFGRLVQSDDATGKRTTYTYDAWDRITRTQFPGTDNTFTAVLYDDIQRTIQMTDPEGNITKKTMDLLGRPSKQEAMNASGALKNMAQYTYDFAGNMVTQKDAKEFTTSYAYDVLGRLITVTDPEANATNYVYSLAGNLKETRYPDNAQMTKQYDQMGRVIRKTDPSGGVESYYYDANSNLTKIVNRKGQARTYAYNNRDRQISSTTSQETITMGYDGAGRRLWMQDGTGRTQYSYEAGSGWLRSVTYPDTRKTEYEYDNQGKRTKMTDPFGVVSLYRYDARNQLDAIGSAANAWDAIYAYKKNGLVASADLRNGIRSTFGYDEINLTSLTHTRAGNTLGAFAYQYDQNRNQTSKTESGAAYTFSYDSLNRIATSTQFNETYTYDVRGNRKTLKSDATPNLAEINYTYDDRDRLTKVVTGDNKTVTYRYNGDGLLTERTEAGTTTRYYYDRADIIAEGTVTGGTVSRKASYIRGNGLVSRVDASGNRAYYSQNGHGDVTRLTDQSGNVLNSYTYDMWGNPITTSETIPNLFRYSGEYWDNTTGLQYLRARWYDPSIGRFINEDTYEGELGNPLSQNLYTYVINNPLRYIDPSGHCFTEWLGKKYCKAAWESVKKQAQIEWEFLKEVHSSLYSAADYWSMGTLSELDEYYRISKENPYSLEQFLAAGMIFIEVTPQGKVGKLTNKGQDFISAIKKGCNCFTAGTLVLTDEGEKPIEEIEVGDMVLAKSDETGEVAYKEVVGLFQKQADEIYKVYNGEEVIEATAEHPFWLEGKGWTEVKDLKVGDLLVTSGGATLTIDKIEKEPREATVYNFEVKDFHSYFVSNLGIWVHNCALQNVYKSIKDSPLYPQGFSGAKNGTVKNKVNNGELLEELRAIESGTWHKVYKDGVDANGNKISIHYFQSQSGQVFNVKTKNGWSNSSSQMP